MLAILVLTLIEEGVLLSKDEEVSECFNTYFTNITDTLKTERAPCVTILGLLEHPVHAAILRYSNHPSIIRIKKMQIMMQINLFFRLLSILRYGMKPTT